MARKAIVETATGLVLNVIVIVPDGSGQFDYYKLPVGQELLDSGLGAEPGAIWDGERFNPPVLPPPTRFDDLQTKVSDDTATFLDVLEMLRIERQLPSHKLSTTVKDDFLAAATADEKIDILGRVLGIS